MRRNGYDSYHGRSRVRTFLKVLIVLLLVVLAVAVGALLWLEPYIDYSANGIKINLPFFQQKEPAPATGAPVVVTTPEPTPTPEPEEDFRGILLPNSALYDGTAAQQVEAAGATAALFDMKADDGSLGYISGLALAIQAEASAADPAPQRRRGVYRGPGVLLPGQPCAPQRHVSGHPHQRGQLAGQRRYPLAQPGQ